MGIEVTDLSTLDPDEVVQNQAELATQLQEENPTIDLKRGVLHDLLLNPGAVLQTKNRTEMDRLRQSSSLRQIELDPTIADADTVDNVLSNYRMDRFQGATARGQVTIEINTSNTTTIGAGQILEAVGEQFGSDFSFVAKDDPALINSFTDRLIQPLANGNFAFQIDVTAVNEGVDGNIRKDSAFSLTSPPLNFVKAYATDDFLGGTNVETNQELLTRLQEGLAAKAMSNRVNMNALLREGDDLNDQEPIDYVSSSIVGIGDPEMLRDAHTIFPLHFGGRVDWWLRTQSRIQRQSLRITATLMEKTNDGFGIWQFSLDRDTSAGVHEIGSVLPTGGVGQAAGSYPIEADIRQIDLTGDIFAPDIVDVPEGVYSRFQTITIQFRDTDTTTLDLVEGTDTQDYDIELVGMPRIAETHDFVGGRDQRNYGGDILVKAPVPCFLQLSFIINQQVGSDEVIDEDGIKNALAAIVNAWPYVGALPGSILCETIHDFLFDTMSVSLVDMLGRIRKPNGDIRFIRSSEVLIIPDEPENMVTAKTTLFFLEPEDIALSIVNVGEPPL